MRYVVVIPARYQSTRLPGKPLVDLCGVPMVVRTYRQCLEAVEAKNIYVATDDERIADECRRYDVQVVMTSEDCLTGTDRIAEVAKSIKVDTYINVQGDEPVFNPKDIIQLIDEAAKHPDDIINGYCAISAAEDHASGSVPKVVMRPDGRLLYMSRAPIPTTKKHEFVKAWRQVCAYAFPRAALEAFSSSAGKTQLEKIEDIEILRFLELGFEVRMIEMSDDSIAVDNPEDVAKVEARLRQLGGHLQ